MCLKLIRVCTRVGVSQEGFKGVYNVGVPQEGYKGVYTVGVSQEGVYTVGVSQEGCNDSQEGYKGVSFLITPPPSYPSNCFMDTRK